MFYFTVTLGHVFDVLDWPRMAESEKSRADTCIAVIIRSFFSFFPQSNSSSAAVLEIFQYRLVSSAQEHGEPPSLPACQAPQLP
jgi:hypothetical protein